MPLGRGLRVTCGLAGLQFERGSTVLAGFDSHTLPPPAGCSLVYRLSACGAVLMLQRTAALYPLVSVCTHITHRAEERNGLLPTHALTKGKLIDNLSR